MKRFKFRLQRVLDFKTTLKKESERELARRNGELHSAERRAEEILEEQDKAKLESQGTVTAAELLLHGNYQARLREVLIEQRLMVLQAARAVEDARDAYLEKAIETETLENVKEQRHTEHKEEAQREVRKEVDEMVVQRYRFRKNSN